MRKPPPLRPGDTVAIVSPSAGAAAVYPARFQRAVDLLEARLALRAVPMPNARRRTGWVSAPIEARLDDLHAAFADPAIAGIVCSIGGDHSAQLLERLDTGLVAGNPKVFCGYSDITCLHHAFNRRCELVTFYGPALLPDFGEWPEPDEYVLEQFRRAVMAPDPLGELPVPSTYTDDPLDWSRDGTRARVRKPARPLQSLRDGVAEGPLLAACLPSSRLLLGTSWQPEYRGRVLVVETPPDYRPADADRDLWHLRNAGALAGLAAIVVARPRGMDALATEALHRVVVEVTRPYGYPVVANLDAGHTEPMLTLPLGVTMRVDGPRLVVLESGVEAAG